MSFFGGRRKALLIGAPVVVAVVVVTLTLVWMLPGCSSAITPAPRASPESTGTGVAATPPIDVDGLTGELVAAGIDVRQIGVEGTTLSLVLNTPAFTVDNAIQIAVRNLNLERIAQKAGITYIKCVNNVGGKQVSGSVSIIAPQTVAYAPVVDARAAVDAWVKGIAAREGVEVGYAFEGYRLDVQVTGSFQAIQTAVEGLLMGAFGLYGKGDLDLVTVIAKSETGEIVYEGVTDCLVSQTVDAWLTGEFDASGF